MRALLLPTILLSLTLAACDKQEVKPPADYPLSGTLTGDWSAAKHLRLALVGTGLPVLVTTNSNIGQNIVPSPTTVNVWNFGFQLPARPNAFGVYQVVAFDDANNDAKINLGEPIARNKQWLVYSAVSGTTKAVTIPEFLPGGGQELLPAMTVSSGWNVYDSTQPLGVNNPRPVTTITGYDIAR